MSLALYEINRLPAQMQTLIRGVALYQLAEALRLSGDLPGAAQAYHDAIPALQSGGVAVAVAGAFVNLVKILQVQGQLRLAYATCKRAIGYVAGQSNPRQPAFAPIYYIFADVLRELNQLSDADRYLAQSMEMGRLSGYLPVVNEGGAILARLRLAQGNEDGARAAMEEVIQSVQKTTVKTTLAAALTLQARLLIAMGDLEQAQNWAAGAGLYRAGDPVAAGWSELEWTTYARLLLAAGRLVEALQLLDRCLAVVQADGRAGVALEIYVLRAQAFEQLGRIKPAQEDLLHALNWGHEQGYRRVFLDEGEQLAGLLLAVQSKATASLRGFIQELLSDIHSAGKPSAAASTREAKSPGSAEELFETLTVRELEVLRLLADGSSNRDIARHLFVTEGTVKTHVHNLYAKLGAQSRTQAIARARELKLL